MKTRSRRRRSRRISSRRSVRRNPVARRRRSSRRRMTLMRVPKFSMPTVRRRRSSRTLRSATRSRRVSRRSGGRGIGGMLRGGFGFKELMDRQTLTIGAGAVGSGFLTGFVLQRFGGAQAAGAFSLPGSSSPYGIMAYQLAIPVLGAAVVKRFSPSLAKGMILGGLISVMQSALAMAMPHTAVAATGEYLSSMHELPPGYSAVDTFGDNIYNSSPAFDDAWNK